MQGDWLKLHRGIIESRVFSDEFLFRLFVWCLCKANWKRGWKQGCEVLPGQFATGELSASEQLGVSGSKWRRGMKKLKEFGCIETEATNRFTLITIVNWGLYQLDDLKPTNNRRASDEQPTSQRRTTDELPTTIEEGKKERKKEGKKERKGIYSSTFESFWSAFPSGRKGAKKKASVAFEKALNETTAENLIASAVEYAASEVGRGEYVKGPTAWLNGGCWDDDRESWKDKKTAPVVPITFQQAKERRMAEATSNWIPPEERERIANESILEGAVNGEPRRIQN